MTSSVYPVQEVCRRGDDCGGTVIKAVKKLARAAEPEVEPIVNILPLLTAFA